MTAKEDIQLTKMLLVLETQFKGLRFKIKKNIHENGVTIAQRSKQEAESIKLMDVFCFKNLMLIIHFLSDSWINI